MLSLETETRIAKFLEYLNESHTLIDSIKRTLNSASTFDPFAIFSRIDSNSKGNIDYIDVITWFKDHMIYLTTEEAQNIWIWYDYDNDSLWSYGEFINMILADETRNLSNIPNRPSNYRSTRWCYDIETMLIDLMEKELRFNRVCRDLLLDIRCRFDFDVRKVYNALSCNRDYITKDTLRGFMIRNKISFCERDIENIIHRMDIGKNGSVSIRDFEKIINLPVYKDDTTRWMQITRNGGLGNSDNLFSHSIANGTVSNARETAASKRNPNSTSNNSLSTSYNNNTTQLNLSSYTNSNVRTGTHSEYTSPDTLLINLFTWIYKVEVDIEKIKTEIALRKEFNVEDAFRLFENLKQTSQNNELSEIDIFTGWNSWGLYPTDTEVHLLIKKYSLWNTKFINYADFFDMVTPFDKAFRNVVEKRASSPYIPKFNRSDLFLGTTKKLLADLFEKIIVSENKIEVIRKRIARAYTINIKDFVCQIDKAKKGYISYTDLRCLWKEIAGDDISDKNCDLSFIRFDRNRDGRVEYEDMINETKELLY